jgi:hypothetical protein
MSNEKTMKRRARDEHLEQLVDDANKLSTLEHWTSFVEELQIPPDLFPAIATSRPELLVLAQPRDMSKEEVEKIYKLLAGLIRTNIALRLHAEQTALLVKNWLSAFTHLESVGRRIENFANFRKENNDEDSDATV